MKGANLLDGGRMNAASRILIAFLLQTVACTARHHHQESQEFLLLYLLFQWATTPTYRQFGSSGNDEAMGLWTDPVGGLHVVGYTTGATTGNPSAGGTDMFIRKFTAAGGDEWSRQPGTSGEDYGFAVTGDSAGIYVAGWSDGAMHGQTNLGLRDVVLIRYDPNGTHLWTRQHGSTQTDVVFAATSDASANAFLGGYTYGDLDGYTNQGPVDILTLKYDSTGNRLWTRMLGTAQLDGAFGTDFDGGASVYVTGGSRGNLDGNLNTLLEVNDYFLTKYDLAGNKSWTRLAGTNAHDFALAVVSDVNGNPYVTGTTSGSLDGQTHAAGDSNSDVFVVKYDSSGNRIWTVLIGSAGNDAPKAMLVEPSGGVWVTGWTEGTMPGNAKSAPAALDSFFARLSSDGQLTLLKQIGNGDIVVTTGIARDLYGRVWIAGYLRGSMFGAASLGQNDAFLLRLNEF